MSAKPASETVRSSSWLAAAVVLLGAMLFVYFNLMSYCVHEWSNKPEYSHGFLVPVFAVYLAWRWRAWVPKTLPWPEPWGLAFLAGGAGFFLLVGITNEGKEWLQGVSLVLNLFGVALLLGGWKTLRWLAPSLAFLLFMFPLPYGVQNALGWQLQKAATVASTFVLQTIGYPAYFEGNVIHVRDQQLEVAQACNGLSMLLTFLALAAAMAVLVSRPWLDRIFIVVSAIPIAVVSNVIRIVATGVLYDVGGKELGDKVFHDFAGWLMMPLALGMIWLELKVLDWIFVEDLSQASREDVLKNTAANPAILFMLNNPALGTLNGGKSKNKPTAKPMGPGPGASR